MPRLSERGKVNRIRVMYHFTRYAGGTTYVHPAWRAYTVNRNPDIELDNADTRVELLAKLKAKGIRPGQFWGG